VKTDSDSCHPCIQPEQFDDRSVAVQFEEQIVLGEKQGLNSLVHTTAAEAAKSSLYN